MAASKVEWLPTSFGSLESFGAAQKNSTLSPIRTETRPSSQKGFEMRDNGKTVVSTSCKNHGNVVFPLDILKKTGRISFVVSDFRP